MNVIFCRKRAWTLGLVVFVCCMVLISLTRPGNHLEPINTKPKLAIFVPFRDRFEELLKFAPHMCEFLHFQEIPFRIFVINQVDSFRFNRGSLINIGFLQTSGDFDYLAMHDVDLLPENPNLPYSYPSEGPFHVASPDLHPKYHYKKFVGGILLLTMDHFSTTKGLSNRFWGWGREDDEFFLRMKDAGLTLNRPVGIDTGYNTFTHIHGTNRKRDSKRCPHQKAAERRDRITGFHDVKYNITSEHHLQFGDRCPVTVMNVALSCDELKTPWCVDC